jgi:DNA-binding SARP family transcriptional activator
MEFKILGPLEVRAGDRDVTCKSNKQRLLLSVLLLNANEVVSSDRLVDVLWGDRPPETSKALQMHVSQLRRTLEPGVLVTRAPGYELRVGPRDVDVHRFEAAVQEGRSELAAGRPLDARRVLREGLSLWRGPPLADLTFEESLQHDIARLEELRLSAIETRIDADLALGNHAETVAELEKLAAEHPTRERFHAQLMLALYRSGRQAEALEAYRDTRRALVDELGLEPGRELQELEARILAHDPGLELAAVVDETLIGRERELASLLPLVDRALTGSGGLLLIAGEPGIGKSRLAETLAGRAQERGARVLVGRCWEAGGAPAYWPWAQALRGYTGTSATELTALFPELTEAPVDGDGARFRLFDAVGGLIRQAATEGPLAIFLDDLHAADSPSLLLLRFVSSQLAGSPVLISCCYRDTEVGPELAAAFAELSREASTHRVALAGLDGYATGRLLADTMGGPPPEDLMVQVQEETQGNPLFVAELGRLLAAGEWRNGHLPIPDGVRETISRRLERRSDCCREVLEVASAFGREFEPLPLGRVCGLDETALLSAIDEATQARFVGPVPGGGSWLRFSHVLMRDALYEGLSSARRMTLHREIAAVLEERNAASSEIAHHYLLGGDSVTARAVAYATRAGDDAAAQHAHEEAARHYATALDVMAAAGIEDVERTCDLLLAMGDELSRAGDAAGSKEPLQRAAAIADREGWPERLTRAALAYGGRFAWGRASMDPALVPLLERALDAVGEQDSPARVRLLGRLAAARRDEAPRPPRVRLAEEAVEMARRIGDPGTLGYALEARFPAVETAMTLDGRFERIDELLTLSTRTGNLEQVFVAHDYRMNTVMALADRGGVDAERAALTALADELRQPAQRWSASTAATTVALMEGRFDEAAALIDATYAIGENAYRWNADVTRRVQLFLLRHAQGRLAEVEASVAEAVHLYPACQRFLCMLAHVHAELGNERRARQALAQATAHELGREFIDEEWMFAMNLLPSPVEYVGDDELAAELYDVLLPFERNYAHAPVEGSFGAMAQGLGALARRLGRLDDAARHFEDAIDIERSMRAWPWVAHAQHGLGETLLARGEDTHARAALTDAIAGYRELGMESWAERAAAL